MITVDEKTCTKCETHRPAEDFHKRASSPDGLQPWCKFCNNRVSAQRHRERRAKEAREREEQERLAKLDADDRAREERERLRRETPELLRGAR